MTDPTVPTALRATGLGRRFRSRWALRDCAFTVPAGKITALVGPNGAGKSTLFHLATGLLHPTTGELSVFGATPGSDEARARTAFLAQDKPLYPRFTVGDTLRFGRELNDDWDQAAAERIVRAGDIPFDTRIGTLSQGQATRVALAVAFGKRPELLLLDEPLADLDPLVRIEAMGLVMEEVAERGTTVVISSHILSELESVCDHVLLLKHGGVRLDGDVQRLCEDHVRFTGLADASTGDGLPAGLDRGTVVEATVTGRQLTAFVRGTAPTGDHWITETPSLEELLLAYLRSDDRPTEDTGRDGAAA
ncbi:ATP-binding cassette domain-containing protein [Streptomyces albireticuli]|uniref:ABC transporter ATP-binding protein n=1 Tax=Streptomyces albireticuli TaxID=1940 RepID=A0A2A2CY78_9ACTN|nr:ABC transporter ATP-binding protein [Streptomyces albireticuli]MCD9144430.1 ABC transporter ATP-binding protein [Streptomyces albireticuli]MCD9163507.1 ABC transporter ATP-binding protein [Streptomyces albireticuli]MCD9193107.1 ABC transporter ATP-binding protein [Streptomyces albireticuli]PAU44052.1 ABC transporter ATP-binding protein [Streptomyces albireticuli]